MYNRTTSGNRRHDTITRKAFSHYTKAGKAKFAYSSEKEAADRAAKHVDAKGEHFGAPYKCADCDGWHIGGGERNYQRYVAQQAARKAATVKSVVKKKAVQVARPVIVTADPSLAPTKENRAARVAAAQERRRQRLAA